VPPKISDKNKRLKPNGTSRFLIWSIPPETTCPERTKKCSKRCYAKKSRYPRLVSKLKENLAESEDENFVLNMVEIISENLRKDRAGKKVYFRIHESGDFYDLNYLKKWLEIASKFPEVTFLAYTKSVKLIDQVGLDAIPKNLVIRYSVWSDTSPNDLKIATDLKLPIFATVDKSVVGEEAIYKDYTKCISNCQLCKKCYSLDVPKISEDVF